MELVGVTNRPCSSAVCLFCSDGRLIAMFARLFLGTLTTTGNGRSVRRPFCVPRGTWHRTHAILNAHDPVLSPRSRGPPFAVWPLSVADATSHARHTLGWNGMEWNGVSISFSSSSCVTGVQADRARGRDWAYFGQVRSPQQHSILAVPQDQHRAHVPAAVAADAGGVFLLFRFRVYELKTCAGKIHTYVQTAL